MTEIIQSIRGRNWDYFLIKWQLIVPVKLYSVNLSKLG